MFAEKNKENEEFFNLKSNSDPDIDIIIMYRGGYKVINSNRILLYDEDIKKWLIHIQ
jgi:muramoyltetrapeptide carboxypeptidase LdcA involved in peptidoglycan recycling